MEFNVLLQKFKDFGVIDDLKNTWRWSDARHKNFPKENDWQHVCSCILRAEDFYNRYPVLCKTLNLNVIKITILIHDAPEAYAKYKDVDYCDPEREMKKTENDEAGIFRKKFIEELKFDQKLLDYYLGTEEQITKEGAFVKVIDRFDGYVRHWTYLPDEELLDIDEYKNCWNRVFGPAVKFYELFNKDELTKEFNDVFSKFSEELFHYNFIHLSRFDDKKSVNVRNEITNYKDDWLKNIINNN